MREESYMAMLVASTVVNCSRWMDSVDAGEPNFDYYLVNLFAFTEAEALAKKVTIDEAMITHEKVYIMKEVLMA